MSELMPTLADLPSAEPGAARAERIRARCRARLAGSVPRTAPPDSRGRRIAPRVWQTGIAVLGAVYLAVVIVEALGVYGLQ